MTQKKQNQAIEFDTDDDGEICNVDYIISDKIVDGKTYYLIKWEGYSSKYNSWEPVENIQHLEEVIEEYFEKKEKKQQKQVEKFNQIDNQSEFDDKVDEEQSGSKTPPKLTKRQLKIKENKAKEEQKKETELQNKRQSSEQKRRPIKQLKKKEEKDLFDILDNFENNFPCIEIDFNGENYFSHIGDFQNYLKEEEQRAFEIRKQKQLQLIEKNKEKAKEKEKEKQQQLQKLKQDRNQLNLQQNKKVKEQDENQNKQKQIQQQGNQQEESLKQKRNYTKRQLQTSKEAENQPEKYNQELKDLKEKLEQLEQNKISEDMLLNSVYRGEDNIQKRQDKKIKKDQEIQPIPFLDKNQLNTSLVSKAQGQPSVKTQQQAFQQSTQNQVNLQQIYQFGAQLGPGMPFQFPGQFPPGLPFQFPLNPQNMPPQFNDRQQGPSQNKPMQPAQLFSLGQPVPMIGPLWPNPSSGMFQQFPPDFNKKQIDKIPGQQQQLGQQPQQQLFPGFSPDLFGFPPMPMQGQQPGQPQYPQPSQLNQKPFDPNWQF